MEFKDYYRIVGVARDAAPDEIKRAYRKQAHKYHPDVSRSPHAERRFQALGEAYAVLKDLKKRAAYDRSLSDGKAGQASQPPPAGKAAFEPAGPADGGSYAGYFSAFFDLLAGRGLASGWRSQAMPQARGEDYHGKVMIDLEDAYRGATRRISLQTPAIDRHGRVASDGHALDVSIPVGIRPGQQICLAGQGAPGLGEGQPGDLYLEVGFYPHEHFRVEQGDVYLDLPVTPWEAALGCTVSVPAPNGMIELEIPAGSAHGSKLRLDGRGIPGSAPGDFYVLLQITLPPAENDETQAVYRNLAGQFKSFNPRAGLGV